MIKVINSELSRLLERAMAILEEERTSAMKLAQRLIEERVLTGNDVAEAMALSPTSANTLPPRRVRPDQRQDEGLGSFSEASVSLGG